MAFMFENLAVYQRSLDFAEQIISLTETFPRGYYFLADQMNRASVSIATNLAEGNGRFTKSDRKNFFTIARRLGTGVRTSAGIGTAEEPGRARVASCVPRTDRGHSEDDQR